MASYQEHRGVSTPHCRIFVNPTKTRLAVNAKIWVSWNTWFCVMMGWLQIHAFIYITSIFIESFIIPWHETREFSFEGESVLLCVDVRAGWRLQAF